MEIPYLRRSITNQLILMTMKHQIAIIGGGPAGYTAAETAARAGLSVVLFEKQALGGVCLNEGCIPTKTLLYSAKTYDQALHASKYAVTAGEVTFDLPKIIARKQKVIRKLVLGIKGKLTAAGVTIVTGEARVDDAHHVTCGDDTYECDHLLLATGSETFIPPIPGLDSVPYWTHREALNNKEMLQSIIIVGGGVIGMEFASFFSSLGAKVTVIEMLPEILGAGIDPELAAMLRAEYTKRGVTFLLETKVTGVAYGAGNEEKDREGNEERNGAGEVAGNGTGTGAGEGEPLVKVRYQTPDGSTGEAEARHLLLSVGRRPVTRGFGLENLGLATTERGQIVVNGFMQTSVPNVYVIGDLTGHSLLAHTAVREAEVAVHHICSLLQTSVPASDTEKVSAPYTEKVSAPDAMSYRAIPGVVYTNPEIAGVGETEASLRQKGIAYTVKQLPMAYSGRFVAENEGVNGLCKLLIGEDDTVLGAHVLGNPASEIIVTAGMAIELRLKTDAWKRMVFPHPTVGEIFKEVL